MVTDSDFESGLLWLIFSSPTQAWSSRGQMSPILSVWPPPDTDRRSGWHKALPNIHKPQYIHYHHHYYLFINY